MELDEESPAQLLEQCFLKVFKTVKFNKEMTLIVVSDGNNDQPFCINNREIQDLLQNFTKNRAEDFVEMLKMNFDHIYSE